jgi:hypothetical protein
MEVLLCPLYKRKTSDLQKDMMLTIVPEMSKRLIIDPKFKFVAVLDNAESISSNVPREQEGRIIPLNRFKIKRHTSNHRKWSDHFAQFSFCQKGH